MSRALTFKLNADDVGWPPYASETIPVEKVDGGFRILAPPLFVKDLSVGDIVSGSFDDEGYLNDFVHGSKSNNSTIWIMPKGFHRWDSVQDSLVGLGCKLVPFKQLGFFSIDLPADVSLEKFDQIVAALLGAGGEVAYPSLRHTENYP